MDPLGNYSLTEIIGEGGMAVVWRAEHNRLHHPVAIKILNKEYFLNNNIRNRFLAEARSMFRMSHPNIVKVTDLIDQPDQVAFVMEYVEGTSLKEYLEEIGPLPHDKVISLFSQMLEAVGYVHAQQLIHRDIKPSNFMVTPDGKIKLMDFGIAKHSDASKGEFTSTGAQQQMGTPMYMSPEQIKSTGAVTAATDIYSLGVVLWQMITAKRPYDLATLSNFELQNLIVHQPLEETHSPWDAIISRCTKKEPGDRFGSCEEIKEAVEAMLEGKLPPPDIDRKQFSASKKIKGKLALVLIIVASVIGGGALFYFSKDAVVEVVTEIIAPPVPYLLQDGQYVFVNAGTEERVDSLQYDYLESFQDGLAIAGRNGPLGTKYGYVERSGLWKVMAKYKMATPFSEELAAVSTDDGGVEKWGFIDMQGQWKIAPGDYYYMPFSEGLAAARMQQGDDYLWGFIDKNGVWEITAQFVSVQKFSEGLAPAAIKEKRSLKWGFIDKKGNWVIPAKYNQVQSFSEGLAAVQVKTTDDIYKWGFIDEKDEFKIAPQYNWVLSFSEGTAAVKSPQGKNYKWGFIDKDQKWVINPSYDYVQQGFHNGLARISSYLDNVNRGYYLDKKGNEYYQKTMSRELPYRDPAHEIEFWYPEGRFYKTGRGKWENMLNDGTVYKLRERRSADKDYYYLLDPRRRTSFFIPKTGNEWSYVATRRETYPFHFGVNLE